MYERIYISKLLIGLIQCKSEVTDILLMMNCGHCKIKHQTNYNVLLLGDRL